LCGHVEEGGSPMGRGRGKGGKATGPTVRVLVMDVELFRVVREAELS